MERHTFESLSYCAELSDYIGPLATDDRKALESHLLRWSLIFPDAWEQAPMNDKEFRKWRVGFERERAGTFSGQEWVDTFGAIIMPERSILASQIEMKLKAPWGMCLKRLADYHGWAELARAAKEGE